MYLYIAIILLMIRRRYILVLGIWLIILSFLGIPGSWRTVLLIATGIVLILFAFYLRFKRGGDVNRGGPVDAFVDNGPVKFSEIKPENSPEPTDAKDSNPKN